MEIDSNEPQFCKRLKVIFDADPIIDEIGLLFNISANDLTIENAFIHEDHKLGIEFSAAPAIFREARTLFHILNSQLRNITNESTDSIDILGNELVFITHVILLISADFYTAWNVRKLLVLKHRRSEAKELEFCNLVFTLHPKSIDTWAYRRWLADRIFQVLSHDKLYEFVEQQTAYCRKLANSIPRNYHAWTFSHWILSRLCNNTSDSNLSSDIERVLRTELQHMTVYCQSHLMDFSGWNHRHHVVNLLLIKNEKNGKTEQILADEYRFISDLLLLYGSHEALWCHFRYVCNLLVAFVCKLQVNIQDSCPAITTIHESIQDGAKEDIVLDRPLLRWASNPQEYANLLSYSAIIYEAHWAWHQEVNGAHNKSFSLWVIECMKSKIPVKNLLQDMRSQLTKVVANSPTPWG